MVILTIFQPPESPILCEQANTRAILDNRDLGVGTLYISERTFCWKEPEGLGFCIEYPHISMHAIATDPNVYPTKCVVIMLDAHVIVPGGLEVAPPLSDPEDGNESESECDESQLLIIPSDAGTIEEIFSALNECQTLNPDPADIIEEEDNVYEDAEDFVAINRMNDFGAGGDSDVGYLSAQLRNHSLQGNYVYGNGDQNFDDDQFEDAD